MWGFQRPAIIMRPTQGTGPFHPTHLFTPLFLSLCESPVGTHGRVPTMGSRLTRNLIYWKLLETQVGPSG